jgi:hypothetical protein
MSIENIFDKSSLGKPGLRCQTFYLSTLFFPAESLKENVSNLKELKGKTRPFKKKPGYSDYLSIRGI